mmetsp:Transcript_35428/g.56646  ORF Transcript_35428/g.56646 Transcript_35428/m.56646 type:complete len:95 (-) Transcript_35428:484-768(-)
MSLHKFIHLKHPNLVLYKQLAKFVVTDYFTTVLRVLKFVVLDVRPAIDQTRTINKDKNDTKLCILTFLSQHLRVYQLPYQSLQTIRTTSGNYFY